MRELRDTPSFGPIVREYLRSFRFTDNMKDLGVTLRSLADGTARRGLAQQVYQKFADHRGVAMLASGCVEAPERMG